jgi:hypothetical protein
MSSLLTAADRVQLLENGRRSAASDDNDHWPVVKLFTPDAGATWLLTEISPVDPDVAFGLCDLGLGSPEIGSVLMSEIDAVRGRYGLPVERDQTFRADRSLTGYATLAWRWGRIIA